MHALKCVHINQSNAEEEYGLTRTQESRELVETRCERSRGKTLPSPDQTATVASRKGVRRGTLQPHEQSICSLRSKSGGTTESRHSSCKQG